MKLNRKNKKGFTIVELVIVIAVIGILSAVLIPTFVNLSNQAQETAKKQQVADAYTAYLVEATDNKYDNLFTRSGAGTTESPYSYTAKDVAIVHKAQSGVAMELKGEWFTYTADKGWEKQESEPANKALVCAPYDSEFTFTAANYLFHKEGEGYTQLTSSAETDAAKGNAKVSTFNGVTVYYKTVA